MVPMNNVQTKVDFTEIVVTNGNQIFPNRLSK